MTQVAALRALHRRLVLFQRALGEIRRALDHLPAEQAKTLGVHIAALEGRIPPQVTEVPRDDIAIVGERASGPESFALVCALLERLAEHVDRAQGIGSGARLREMQADLRAAEGGNR